MDYDNIPTWDELGYLTGWKDQGCPAGHRNYDARRAVEILHRLLEGLPKHIPIYAWGTPEWKAELKRLREERGKLDGVRNSGGSEGGIPGGAD